MFAYLSFGGFKNHKNVYKIKKTIYLMGMLLVPCILQIMVFSNHSYVHEFSVLKLSIPLATIPFVLLPITIFLFVEEYVNKKIKMYNGFKVHINLVLLLIFLMSFSIASVYTINEHPHYKALYPPINDNFVIIGTSIEKNTVYNDVVFSHDFEIPENPPQLLAYSMKRVYAVNSTAQIESNVTGLNASYNIVLVFLNPPNSYWTKILGNTTPIIDKNIYYYRFKFNEFQ